MNTGVKNMSKSSIVKTKHLINENFLFFAETVSTSYNVLKTINFTEFKK